MSFDYDIPKLPTLTGLPSLSPPNSDNDQLQLPTLTGVPFLSSELTAPSGWTGERHPEIFQRLALSTPRKPGQLSQDQLDQYYEKGYIIVHDFFTPEELKPIRKSIEVMVDQLSERLFTAEKIKSLYKDLGFYERLTAIEQDFPGSNMILLKTGKLVPEMQQLASNERLLNLLEDLIGPKIAFSPQWNLRCKTPKNIATVVPWHQDAAYFDNDIYDVHVASAWIPLLDATFENGTLQMISRCHKNAMVARHNCCSGTDFYVYMDEDEMVKTFGCDLDKDVETLDVPMGSFVLFNNFTPHQSLPNVSRQIRWALDFRWQREGTPAGSHGLKETLLLRTPDNPHLKPDWKAFNSVDRNKEQLAAMGRPVDEFSTEVSGPWMNKWPIINHNRHTAAFVKSKA